MKKILAMVVLLLFTVAVLVPIVLKYSHNPVAELMKFSDSFPRHVFIEKDSQGDVVEVHLDQTRVTYAGMVRREGMTNLQTLSLSNTDITDLGLTHIKGLKNLKTLHLDKWTLFSETSIADLKKALPNCKIYH